MTSAFLLGDIARDEGFRPCPYQDGGGVWTNGFGNTHDVGPRTPVVSLDEARARLAANVGETIAGLDAQLPWWRSLNDARQDVLVNMAFNLGVRGLLQFKHTLEAIQGGVFGLASAGMLGSHWATQVGARARRLAQIMETGVRT